MDEGRSDLEVRPARIQKFERFEQRPPVLLHEEGSEGRRCSRLAFLAVDQNRLCVLVRRIDEIHNLSRDVVFRVEQLLVVRVDPVEGQIHDSDGLPVIRNFLSGAVNYMCDFVTDHEFEVLGSQFVPDEERIFDLDCSDHILNGLWTYLRLNQMLVFRLRLASKFRTRRDQ